MKKFLLLTCSSLIALSVGFADDAPNNKNNEKQPSKAANSEVEIGKISEAFGHLIGKNLETIGVQFDMHQVIKGLEDAVAGKTPPMTEVECIQAISAVQEKLFKKHAEQNLQTAENFLTKNAAEEGMVVLEKGKVHYKVEKEGNGAIVEDHFSPMIRYVGKFVDGSSFGASKEEELLSLDETIPGLKAGLIGMKEGEKRIVYIHPDLGYGTQGFLPPNSLLSFEIEVVKANASQAEMQESPSNQNSNAGKGEIALPGDAGEKIR